MLGPYMKPLPPNATPEVRWQMYQDFVLELVRHYPKRFLPFGVKRRWWHWQLEHPLTKYEKTRPVIK